MPDWAWPRNLTFLGTKSSRTRSPTPRLAQPTIADFSQDDTASAETASARNDEGDIYIESKFAKSSDQLHAPYPCNSASDSSTSLGSIYAGSDTTLVDDMSGHTEGDKTQTDHLNRDVGDANVHVPEATNVSRTASARLPLRSARKGSRRASQQSSAGTEEEPEHARVHFDLPPYEPPRSLQQEFFDRTAKLPGLDSPIWTEKQLTDPEKYWFLNAVHGFPAMPAEKYTNRDYGVALKELETFFPEVCRGRTTPKESRRPRRTRRQRSLELSCDVPRRLALENLDKAEWKLDECSGLEEQMEDIRGGGRLSS